VSASVVLRNNDVVGGAIGTPGPAGPVGPAGPPGATGPAGSSGPAGPAGANGAPGPAGPAGATDPRGQGRSAAGCARSQGPTGATGPQGDRGAGRRGRRSTGPSGVVGFDRTRTRPRDLACISRPAPASSVHCTRSTCGRSEGIHDGQQYLQHRLQPGHRSQPAPCFWPDATPAANPTTFGTALHSPAAPPNTKSILGELRLPRRVRYRRRARWSDRHVRVWRATNSTWGRIRRVTSRPSSSSNAAARIGASADRVSPRRSMPPGCDRVIIGRAPRQSRADASAPSRPTSR
jgi:hypothetical protein